MSRQWCSAGDSTARTLHHPGGQSRRWPPNFDTGWFNEAGILGSSGLALTELGDSTTSTSIEERTITSLESREATDEEVTASIGCFLEEYPQYSEEALREVVAEESQEGKISFNRLEELELAIDAPTNGVVTAVFSQQR